MLIDRQRALVNAKTGRVICFSSHLATVTHNFINKYVIFKLMSYTVLYYNDKVQADILALPPSLLARYISLTERMLVAGSNLGEPHTKAFGDGLFELRLKSDVGIGRVFYCTMIGKRIVMLHSFVKKTQKTPNAELEIALSRLKEMKSC